MSISHPSTARLDRLLNYIERDAGNMVLRKDAIREAMASGQRDMARGLIDAGLQMQNDDAELLAFSALAYLQAQHYANAEQVLLEALAVAPDVAELHYNMAFAQFMQKRYDDALKQLLRPGLVQALPLALTLRARCHFHLQRPLAAIADCKERLGVSPDDAETRGLVALLLYEQGQADDAMENVAAALRLAPRQLEAMLTLALLQADAQDHDAARSSFESLLQAYPECGRGWLGLGMLKLSRMDIEAARGDIELAAIHMPEHIGTWHALAWLQIMQGDIAAAGVSFEQAMALDRNFGETHGGLAVIAALEGREAEASASIRRALRLNPQGLSAQYAEMLLLKRRGEEGAAKAVLDAFLASTVPGTGLQYRDLVATHMKSLALRAADRPDGATLH
ncbi:MAG: tetratricopeptide repeat protein [Rhizobacter sp.]